MALTPLTVSFQEPALLARLNSENNGGDATPGSASPCCSLIIHPAFVL